MMITPFKQQASRAISPLILVGVLMIVIPIVGFMTLDSIRLQEGRMTEKLTGKGVFLIRAFEAGTRNGMLTMRWGVSRVQRLLSETASLPEIDYMMIVDDTGRILAHSDPERVGTRLDNLPDFQGPGASREAFHREVVMDGGHTVFEVIKRFTPALRAPGSGRGLVPACDLMGGPDCDLADPDEPAPGKMNSAEMHPAGMNPREPRQRDDLDWFRAHFVAPGQARDFRNQSQFILAGLSMEEAELARKMALRHGIITGLVLFFLGGAGLVSLFVLQEYRSARSSLLQVRAFSDKVVETMPAGLIAVDPDLAMTSVNAEAGRILGLQPGAGTPERKVLPPEMASLAREMKTSDGPLVREMMCTLENGGTVMLDISASPMRDDNQGVSGYLFLFRDLTEIRSLKQEVERSRRLAAVGKLAAGVAHEIRNPLSSIKGFATWFRERYSHRDEDTAIADVMIQEVERLNRSVTQLLEFARPVPVDARQVVIREIMDHSLMLVDHDLKAAGIQAEIRTETARETLTVDPDLLKQILLNLYLNAIQAMVSGGRLSVFIAEADREGSLLITVQDTGRGIPEGDLERIFDPYFTTRPGGTGLGLAMVHRAAEALGGEIRVESKPGFGSRFILRLPADTLTRMDS